MSVKNGMRPVHPGEILCEEIETLDLSANELAKELDVSPDCISEVLSGQRDVTADIALRLARYFGTPPQVRNEEFGKHRGCSTMIRPTDILSGEAPSDDNQRRQTDSHRQF